MDLGDFRQDYAAGALRRKDLARDPFGQFEAWFRAAMNCEKILEPNAMTLSTAGRDGRVTSRTVLLKAWDSRGLVFFSNYASAKSRQIAENANVALLFAWLPLERQVAFCGRAERVPAEESRTYFASRPRDSQLGAWASPQSRILDSRLDLDRRLEEVQEKFAEGEIPVPDFWGGFRVVPQTAEFWQGRANRLHDRFLYTREGENSWRIDRLAP